MANTVTELRFPRRGRDGRSGDVSAAPQPLEQMAEQIRLVDDAASQAAERIAAEAARLTAPDAGGPAAPRADLLADLASALVERTEEIRNDCERLSALLQRAIGVVAAHDAQHAAETPAAPREAPEAASAPAVAAPEPPESQPSIEADSDQPAPAARWLDSRDDRRSVSREPRGTSEGVRLIATQMAIAGSSRAEVERRLRVQFGVEDATGALDEIFGNRRSEVG